MGKADTESCWKFWELLWSRNHYLLPTELAIELDPVQEYQQHITKASRVYKNNNIYIQKAKLPANATTYLLMLPTHTPPSKNKHYV